MFPKMSNNTAAEELVAPTSWMCVATKSDNGLSAKVEIYHGNMKATTGERPHVKIMAASKTIRLEQSVNCLVVEALVLQRHPHLTREWAERAVVKLDHSVTPFAVDRAELAHARATLNACPAGQEALLFNCAWAPLPSGA